LASIPAYRFTYFNIPPCFDCCEHEPGSVTVFFLFSFLEYRFPRVEQRENIHLAVETSGRALQSCYVFISIHDDQDSSPMANAKPKAPSYYQLGSVRRYGRGHSVLSVSTPHPPTIPSGHAKTSSLTYPDHGKSSNRNLCSTPPNPKSQ